MTNLDCLRRAIFTAAQGTTVYGGSDLMVLPSVYSPQLSNARPVVVICRNRVGAAGNTGTLSLGVDERRAESVRRGTRFAG